MRIVTFTKYDRDAASTRQRFLQYAPAFGDAGIELELRPLLPEGYMRGLVDNRPIGRASLIKLYARRFGEVLGRPNADLIWIHSELFPYLPAGFDRAIFGHRIPVVFDWDDAVFVPYTHHRLPIVRRFLGSKFASILRGASATTCGNAYLRDYCARFSPVNWIVPTTVDVDLYQPASDDSDRPLTIGWMGSPTTWANVRSILPVLRKFCAMHGARFRAVGTGVDARSDAFSGLDFVDWSEDREVAELHKFDIGIMPLDDGPFQQGKCGYKLIQYMACGIPCIASPIGVNAEIVRDGIGGLHAVTTEDWAAALEKLAADGDLRRTMGKNGRYRVVESYSMQSQAPRLIELFQHLVADAR